MNAIEADVAAEVRVAPKRAHPHTHIHMHVL